MEASETATLANSTRRAAGGVGLHCVQYLPDARLEGGGVARAVLDWCTILAARGLGMTLVSNSAAGIPSSWFNSGLAEAVGTPRAEVISPPGGCFGRFGPKALDTVVRLLKTADVLHLHAPWLTGNRQIAATARRLGVPYLLTPHGMLDDWSMSQRAFKKRFYLRTVGRRFLEGAAVVHCSAAAEAEQASKWFTTPRTTVLPLLCDLSSFRSLPGVSVARDAIPALNAPGLKILFLGRLHEKKGCDLLIRAAAELRRRAIPFVLVMAGPDNSGYRAHLQTLVRELALQDSVVFPGFVEGDQRISLLQSADVLALPTHQENFGFVLTEAMACGTPVVTTQGVDIWQEIQAGGGLIVDRTVASVAQALCDLAGDPAAARARGERSRAWAFEYLDTARLGAAYEALYSRLAADKAAQQKQSVS
jgi:glycosyltransferase involved in cell wall biosynthesis